MIIQKNKKKIIFNINIFVKYNWDRHISFKEKKQKLSKENIFIILNKNITSPIKEKIIILIEDI